MSIRAARRRSAPATGRWPARCPLPEERVRVAEPVELIDVVADADLTGAAEFGRSARSRLDRVADRDRR